jgi:arylsulfatase A-like enzyme
MRRHRAGQISLRPNVPPVASVQEKAKQDLAGYYAQIENLDRNVGRILRWLEANGLDRNTHLVFFSDHGDCHGSHGYFYKSSPWEEAIRIPFLVRPALDDAFTKGSIATAPMNHVDIAPTTLGLCGVDIPDWMEGTDFAHHVLADREAPESEPTSAYLQQVHRKRFHCLNRVWRGIRRTDGWKYICLEGQPFGMWDLNNDPYELDNLAFLEECASKRVELQEELAAWIERTGDAFDLPEI